MTTGQPPFRRESAATIFEAILSRAPVHPLRLNADIPAKLEEIISRCLEKDRNLRYQHASDLSTDLKRLKRQLESKESSDRAPGRMSRLFLGIRAQIAIAAGVAALLAFGAYWFGRRNHSVQRSPSARAMLAVLPFENLSGDTHENYFAHGLTEEMIAQLGQLQPAWLGVIARTSTMR